MTTHHTKVMEVKRQHEVITTNMTFPKLSPRVFHQGPLILWFYIEGFYIEFVLYDFCFCCIIRKSGNIAQKRLHVIYEIHFWSIVIHRTLFDVFNQLISKESSISWFSQVLLMIPGILNCVANMHIIIMIVSGSVV